MRENVRKVLAELVPNIAQDSEITKIILFGSQARGTATIESDIDLAIVAEDPVKINRNEINFIKDRYDIDCNCVYTTQYKIDNTQGLLDVNRSIREEGIVLWQRKEATSI